MQYRLIGVCVAFLALFFLVMSLAHATWKPEYGKSPVQVQQWFKGARPTPAAHARLGIWYCCEQAERLMTKFIGVGDDWWYFTDPACTHRGCKIEPIPNDVVHTEPIRAIVPEDDDLPEFAAMRTEGVLFIWDGKPTCFWPPRGGI